MCLYRYLEVLEELPGDIAGRLSVVVDTRSGKLKKWQIVIGDITVTNRFRDILLKFTNQSKEDVLRGAGATSQILVGLVDRQGKRDSN